MNDINTSVRRIVITEDEDLDLEKLLLGDTSGEKFSSRSSSPTQLSLPPLRETPASPTSTQCVDKDKSSAIRQISAWDEEEEDEDDGGFGNWMLPAAAQLGDFMNNSIHRVPSKSILKKTSSYGNFEPLVASTTKVGGGMKKKSSFLSFNNFMDTSSTSQGSGSRHGNQVANSSLVPPPPRSGEVSKTKMPKKKSFLCMDMSRSSNSSGSRSQQSSAIGLDLDDSLPSYTSPSSSAGNKCIVSLASPSTASLAPDGNLAGGMDSSGSRSAGSTTKIRRNVSFHAVNVRQYDRTIGDNPSCRSGPPLSLDWGYSKENEKCLDEYELERSSSRAKSLSKIHVNKYKRRNLLAFQWGHSEEEMKEARDSTKKLQRQRSITQMLLPVHKAEEAMIGIKNFIKKKKKGGVTTDDNEWSDMSNSASTKDSSRRDGNPRITL